MMAQPGFVEGPWQRFETNFTSSVPAASTYTNGPTFLLTIQQEDILRFGGGGIILGAGDASGKLQLVTQSVYIQMQSGYLFVLPLYPPTQLNFPADTYANGAYLVTTLPPLEVTGEALGSGGWPKVYFGTSFSVHNTDGTNAHSFTVSFSLPYQRIQRARAV